MLMFLFINTSLIGFGIANEDTLGHMTIIETEGSDHPVTVVSEGGDYSLVENEAYSTEGASEQGSTGILAFASTLLNTMNQFYILITSLLFAYSSIFVILGLPPLLIWVLTVAIGLFEMYIIIELLVPVVSAVRGVFGL